MNLPAYYTSNIVFHTIISFIVWNFTVKLYDLKRAGFIYGILIC